MSASRLPPPIDGFEPLMKLGRGGMGTAYLARRAGDLEALVVLKVLHARLLGSSDSRARFCAEAELASAIQHENVVRVHEVRCDETAGYLVLDYVEGLSLEELVDRAYLKGERLEPRVLLRVALDAARGLEAIHAARDASGRELGILHRDLSPQNLLVGRDGVTRVADLGVAKSRARRTVTSTGVVLGRPLYLPPEYLRGQPFDESGDVYALGLTLWFALMGQEPWQDLGEPARIQTKVTDGVPRLGTEHGVPEALGDLVARATATERVSRIATPARLAEGIERLGTDIGLASRSDVAWAVQRIAGTDLERRRALLAERMAQRARPCANADSSLPRTTWITALGAARRRWWLGLGTIVIAAGAVAAYVSQARTSPDTRPHSADATR